uniref:Uncharacterized protein n=1 Tax=Timema douglasi TaxID=61478 RepID=A0A7R8VM31_TIMDO|nr:unnamed protein product [Timema douglasi]
MPGFVEEEGMGENEEASLRTSDIKQRLNLLLANRHSTGSSMAGIFGPIPYNSNHDLLVIGSLVYCEGSVLNHAAIKADLKLPASRSERSLPTRKLRMG